MKLYNCIWHIPTVYTLHLAPIPHDWLHRLATWCGHHAIAISHEVEEFLHCAFKVPYNRISRVLNGVPQYELEPVSQEEKTNLRRGYGIDNDKLVISLHSRIDAVKNHLAVAEALNMLPDEARNKIVVLCSGNQSGDYYNQLMQHIKAYHLEPQFCFCGWKTAREVIGASDLLLLPSMKEGFGLTCIESMFLRVPVARTKAGGFEDMKNYCIALEDTSAESVKNCILNFINNRSRYSELVEKAYRYVSENCSVEVMVKNTVAVYSSTLHL